MNTGGKSTGSCREEKILDHRGQAQLSALYPLAHLGVGRAAALAGDATQARRSYQDSLSLWKEADSSTRILQEAGREYEKLITE